MNTDWNYGVLRDAVKKESSNISLNKVEEDDGEYPLFGAKGFAKNVSFYDQEKEYLAIIKDGAGVGRVSLHPAQSSVLATLQYILPKEGIDINFVRYFLESIDFDKYISGSTIPHIYFKDYESEPFPLISFSKQKRIVAILDEAFDAIDKAKENVEQNIKNAEELFQSKLEEIFSQRGEGWEKKSLGDLTHVKSGGTPRRSTKEYWDNGSIPWYSSGELNELFTTDSDRLITNKGLEESNTKLFPKGSLLIGMYDTAALKMSILDRNATFNQAISGVKPNDGLNLQFVMHAINAIKPELMKQRRGIRQKNLNLTKIKAIPIPYPKVEIQDEVVAQLSDLKKSTNKLIGAYNIKLRDLEELKKSILQKAFSGELTANETVAV